METVYIEGSAAHQYLSELQMVEEDEVQPSVSLFDEFQKNSQPIKILDPEGQKQQLHEHQQFGFDRQTMEFFYKHSDLLLAAFSIIFIIFVMLPSPFSCYFALIISFYGLLLLNKVINKANFGQKDKSQCNIGQALMILEALKALIIKLSVQPEHRRTITQMDQNLSIICGQFYSKIKQDCISNPVKVCNSINLTLKALRNQLDTILLNKSPKIFKILQYNILRFKYLKLNKKLENYMQIVLSKQIQPKAQCPRVQKCKDQYYDALVTALAASMIQGQQGNDKQGKTKAILNLIKIELIHRAASLKLLTQEKQNQPENKLQALQNVNKIPEQFHRNIQHDYISMSTDGECEKIDHNLIEQQIGDLRGRLDRIIQNKINNNQLKQEKLVERKQEVKLERRIEGFGGLVKAPLSKKIQQYYIE